VAAYGVVAGMIMVSLVLSGGDDLYRYYQPFEHGCFDCGFIPYFSQWFLWPLLLFDHPMAWLFWTAISLVGLLLLARTTKVNPFLFLISFPMLGQVWLGQIDVLICTGLVILLIARNPYLRGLGVALALIKPQLSGLAILAMLLTENHRDLVKILIAPFLVIVGGFFVYGYTWPLEWLQNILTHLPLHAWRLASASIWKFGILLLPVPLLFKDRHKRLLASLLVTSVATPFFWRVFLHCLSSVRCKMVERFVILRVADRVPIFPGECNAVCLDFAAITAFQHHPDRTSGSTLHTQGSHAWIKKLAREIAPIHLAHIILPMYPHFLEILCVVLRADQADTSNNNDNESTENREYNHGNLLSKPLHVLTQNNRFGSSQ
jgi:hypothetical protein